MISACGKCGGLRRLQGRGLVCDYCASHPDWFDRNYKTLILGALILLGISIWMVTQCTL